ncbi:urease accessory protein UreD [Streptomyces hawaiiensis]
MSAPLGGDELALDVTAGTSTRLEVTAAAATIALSGATNEPATYDVRLTVGENASLHWLPQPLISTHGSSLHQTYRVDLHGTSHLLLRKEQLLGRSAEPPGQLSTRLTVLRAGSTILDQQTVYGPRAPAWDGPAVLGCHRATGQLLLVTPDLDPPPAPLLLGDPLRGHCVLSPLADDAALLATAVAPTLAGLRQLLDGPAPMPMAPGGPRTSERTHHRSSGGFLSARSVGVQAGRTVTLVRCSERWSMKGDRKAGRTAVRHGPVTSGPGVNSSSACSGQVGHWFGRKAIRLWSDVPMRRDRWHGCAVPSRAEV